MAERGMGRWGVSQRDLRHAIDTAGERKVGSDSLHGGSGGMSLCAALFGGAGGFRAALLCDGIGARIGRDFHQQ